MIRRPIWRSGAGALLLLAQAAAFAAQLEYGRDVRPILAENCFHCHGQDSSKRMAGLRLDTAEGATASRNGKSALVPGKPQQSLIYLRITAESKALRMPPEHSNRSLTPAQINTLKQWIEEGGQYARHWAFLPPAKQSAPPVAAGGWSRQPFDGFVLHRLEAEGLHPQTEATARTWLRRVSLDLTGLPPSPGDLDAFEKNVAAQGQAAYETAVDHLLASPAYGERMAMEWLDVARYADTHGFNNDAARSMWRWRDWVIGAFNANMPYDRFLTEQLAGDLLPQPTLEQRIATGYGRNHVINSEGGIIAEEYRVEYVADRVRTLGMSWLGLTLECSRCHDHKYDPLTQKDYYRLYAFFNNVPEIGEDGRVANAVPFLAAPTESQQERMQELDVRLASLSGRLKEYEHSFHMRPAYERQVSRIAAGIKPPADTALRLSCEADGKPEGIALVPGIDGNACHVEKPAEKTQTSGIIITRRLPLTVSLWLRPAESDGDAPLLSAADYSRNPAATTYGAGIELRLVNGEFEFRNGDRFPAYSIRVRSEGAALTAGEWHHVALVYSGASPGDNRAHASWVRMFADGREVPISILNDGAGLPDTKAEKPSSRRFRIGWDNHPEGKPYSGDLDEVEIWARQLSPAEMRSVFEARAIPFALHKPNHPWLRRAALRTTNKQFAQTEQEFEEMQAAWLALRREIPTVMVMEEMTPPRQAHVLKRGAYNAPGEAVEPGVPEALLGTWPAGAPRNRLGLAKWLTSPDHPLTARVVVNRFWQQLFGQGLVRTSENFGVQGESPTYPEVLDWLAREFIDSGWNVKALIRRMVLSATYRQDSAAPPSLISRDPANLLLARGPRFRLPAELIRDQALAIAGVLNPAVGGPSVFPYQPADLYKGIVVAADYPGTTWTESKGADRHRRSLYTFWKRTVPHPTMSVFDAPDREFCVVRRSTTNTPLQALTLLNDPIYLEAARKFAQRMIEQGGQTPEARLAFGFRLATGRAPEDAELQVLRKTWNLMAASYEADPRSAALLASEPGGAGAPARELATYTVLANLILNLDEVVTKG